MTWGGVFLLVISLFLIFWKRKRNRE
ncbi:LPXTG cell wall anchor domain-containing protein [Enterococcus faecium]|nr:LPXTG cell wall anchor domain-containing protein [Enterococcus faecium]